MAKRKIKSNHKRRVTMEEPTSSLNISFWPIMFIVAGIVWLIEFYADIDVPLVAILLLLIGIFLLFRKKKR